MIELSGVCLSYGEQRVLTDFNLKIPPGERVALMGRSGAGKTSILKLIMGLIKPDSGRVTLDHDIKISAVFQEDRLVERLSASANCKIFLKKGDSRHEALLNSFGINEELCKKRTSELSGGEKRRVSIARALLVEHGMLLLDEPFKGIDTDTLPPIINEINSDPATVILVTHSVDEAHLLGCRIVEV